MDLWTRAAQRTAHAYATGALAPWTTREEVVNDEGIAFSVRVVSSLAARRNFPKRPGGPFLEPEEDLVVESTWGPGHRLLLNKFPALDDHLLITTRAFVPQVGLLDESDFQALIDALDATDGLGFYNAGPTAGASQPHRHLQIVRTPIGASRGRFPTEALLTDGTAPFRCLATELPTGASAARSSYLALLGRAGRPVAWNLLATRELLAIVPRIRESVGSVSINALGFAGSLFAANDDELQVIREQRPCAILRSVSVGA